MAYESPITKITEDIYKDVIKQENDALLATIEHKVGFKVDGEELVKALNYDRDQYNKGYHDGYLAGLAAGRNQWVRVSERLPEDLGTRDNKVLVWLNGEPSIAWLLGGVWVHAKGICWLEDNDIEWWAPIDEPPKEENE